MGIGINAAVGRVKGPTRVYPAGSRRGQSECPAQNEDVPARQIEAWKCQVARADHHRHQEIAQHGRNSRDEEKENHRHPVHGKQFVVGLRLDQISLRRHQLEPDEGREDAADEKKESHGKQIEPGDAFMVGGQKPRLDAVADI